MTGPIIRILLRVAAGVLIGRGWLSAEDGAALSTDPELFQLLEGAAGAVMWVAAEWYYALTRRWGWAK